MASFKTLNTIKLSKSALDHNVATLRKLAKTEIFPVIKANAYGHGIKEITQMLSNHDLPYLVVSTYFEALDVKKANSDQDVLILSAIDPANATMLDTDFTYVVFNKEAIQALGETGKKFKIHIEIDTGMRRHGVRLEDHSEVLTDLKKYPNLQVTGVMSHLADSDNPDSDDYINQQISKFDQVVDEIHAAGFDPKWIHLAQSGGITRPHSKHANASRPGIALYGINPLLPSDPHYESLQTTKPILSIASRVGAIQNLKAGDKVSYGLTYEAPNDMTIGVLMMGYYDILPRSLSGKIQFGYKGQYLDQVGRICMNHVMFNTHGYDIQLGSEIELISPDRNSPNSIQFMCYAGDIFNYEFLVNINENIAREIIK